jgi:hypothetical protein
MHRHEGGAGAVAVLVDALRNELLAGAVSPWMSTVAREGATQLHALDHVADRARVAHDTAEAEALVEPFLQLLDCASVCRPFKARRISISSFSRLTAWSGSRRPRASWLDGGLHRP